MLRILILPIPDPGSRISDPRSRIQKQQQKRGVKKISCLTFFRSHKFHKIENYFIFETLTKKIWAYFQRITELFTQKIVTKFSKICVWDPGSGKNLFRIPYPRVKKAPDPGSGSATTGTKKTCRFLDWGSAVKSSDRTGELYC